MSLAAWGKRLRKPTLRTVTQNQSLGACYFPYDVLGARSIAEVATLQIAEPLSVLEELANRGRCIVVLPGESHLVLYFVDSESGSSRVVWYARPQRLDPPSRTPRWVVALDLEPAVHEAVPAGAAAS